MKLSAEQLKERKRVLRFLEGADAKLITICDEESKYDDTGVKRFPYVNSMMCQWCMPVSWEPMMICFSIGKERFTHNLLSIGRPCLVSHVPPENYTKAVEVFGRKSGWDGKKPGPENFAGLTFIGEIYSLSDVGDHTLVTAKIGAVTVF